MDAISSLVNKITTILINPLLYLLFAVGLVVFIYGLVEFLVGLNFSKGTSSVGGDKKDSASNGRRHMLYGVIGMFVMVAAWAIVNIIIHTFPVPASPF